MISFAFTVLGVLVWCILALWALWMMIPKRNQDKGDSQ